MNHEKMVIAPLEIRAHGNCRCGCGLPPRIDFRFDTAQLSIVDPEQIDALIKMLQSARRQLWGGSN
jgi:hypothetical protein